MTEFSLPWSGIAAGDAGPYSDDDWSDVWRKLFTYDRTKECVVNWYGNVLHVVNPAGTTIRVETGAGLVDGKFYETDANVDFTIVAPGGGSNYYSVVLRKTWATQTVRAAMLGPSAVAYPAVTQTDGTLWEVLLAQVEITSGGVITITDKRRVVTVGKPTIVARQGGSATDWDVAGTTTYYLPPRLNIQIGVGSIQITTPNVTAVLDVVFPLAYTTKPVVMLTLNEMVVTPVWNVMVVDGMIAVTGFRVFAIRSSDPGIDQTQKFTWVAFGGDYV